MEGVSPFPCAEDSKDSFYVWVRNVSHRPTCVKIRLLHCGAVLVGWETFGPWVLSDGRRSLWSMSSLLLLLLSFPIAVVGTATPTFLFFHEVQKWAKKGFFFFPFSCFCWVFLPHGGETPINTMARLDKKQRNLLSRNLHTSLSVAWWDGGCGMGGGGGNAAELLPWKQENRGIALFANISTQDCKGRDAE